MESNALKNIKLSGVTYNSAQDVIRQIVLEAKNHEFQLVREPWNQFDRNAVRVDCWTLYVGYIPKHLSEKIAKEIDSGRKLMGVLNKINMCSYSSVLGLTIDVVEE